MRSGLNLQCLYRLQSMRHYCTRRPNKWFQWGEKKQTVHVMLQFQPLYVLWLEFQNIHWRPQRENVALRPCAMICLMHFKSDLICVLQVTGFEFVHVMEQSPNCSHLMERARRKYVYCTSVMLHSEQVVCVCVQLQCQKLNYLWDN